MGAQRHQKKGDRLTMDFAATEDKLLRQFACRCGCPCCRGWVIGYDESPNANGEQFFSTLASTKSQLKSFYNASTGRKRYCGGNCSKPLIVAFRLFPATILDAVDATVNRQTLPTVPGVLHNAGMTDIGHLLDHVELAEAVDPFFFSG